MDEIFSLVVAGLLSMPAWPAQGQDATQIVRQAVQTELTASNADHSHWMYYEVDQTPSRPVWQWVAETGSGDLRRPIQIDGQTLSLQEQHRRMESFIADPGLRSRQHKSNQHDDRQAEEMLRMLPDAFLWTARGEEGGNLLLHFKPNPNFSPADMEGRVFAAMEGDMAVDAGQHRIVSLKGRMIRDVKIFGGLLGSLNAGGTFDVERRELAPGIWQIVETHVHIQGHILLFKNISEHEDDVKSDFKPLPANISLQEAESELLAVRK